MGDWVVLEGQKLLNLATGATIYLSSESTSGPWTIEHSSSGVIREFVDYEIWNEALAEFNGLAHVLGVVNLKSALAGGNDGQVMTG